MPKTTNFTVDRGNAQHVFYTIYITLAALAVYYMKVFPESFNLNDRFMQHVSSRMFPQNSLPLRAQYTGISQLDFALSFLVAAFTPGIARWDEGFWLLDLHFLFSFFPVTAIWAVESYRNRNQGAIISFTYIWPLLYQTVGGAIIIPLYYAFYTYTSSKPGYFSPSTRAVPLPRARTLLYALVLGYLVPTILLFLPLSHQTQQLAIALWQPCPLFINLFSFIFSRLSPSTQTPPPKQSKTDADQQDEPDINSLSTIYITTGILSALPHLYIIYKLLTSHNPQHSFAYIFIPNSLRCLDGLTQIQHFIFQIDWWIINAASLTWCAQAIYDASYLGEQVNPPMAFGNVMLGCVVLGPGAMMGLVAWWREGVMADVGKGSVLADLAELKEE